MAAAIRYAPDPGAVYHKRVRAAPEIPKSRDEDQRTTYVARVRLAKLGVVDADSDILESGLLGEEGLQHAAILYAHNTAGVSLGKAAVTESMVGDDRYMVAELRFNPDIEKSRDVFKSIEFDLVQGPSIQEYSFGFKVLEWAEDRVTVNAATGLQQTVWRLKRIEIFEVSPVLRGASVDSGTVSTKGLKPACKPAAKTAPKADGRAACLPPLLYA